MNPHLLSVSTTVLVSYGAADKTDAPIAADVKQAAPTMNSTGCL